MRILISVVFVVTASCYLARGAETGQSHEEVVFRSIENGILGFDEAKLRKTLVDPVRLLDGNEWKLDAALRDLKGWQAGDQVLVTIESVFFIESREDLKGLGSGLMVSSRSIGGARTVWGKAASPLRDAESDTVLRRRSLAGRGFVLAPRRGAGCDLSWVHCSADTR